MTAKAVKERKAAESLPDATAQDEAALIARVQAGDKELFCELIRPHQRRVYAAALAILRNEADAEEVAQEGFLKALTHLGSFRKESKFSTWLIQIVINEARMRLRKNHPEKMTSLEEQQGEDREEGAYRPRDFADWREIPSEALDRKEIRAALLRALASLAREISRGVCAPRRGIAQHRRNRRHSGNYCGFGKNAPAARPADAARFFDSRNRRCLDGPAAVQEGKQSMGIKCEEVWQEISNYLEGELEPSRRAAFEEHFATCRQCASVVHGTQNVLALYRDKRLFEPPSDSVNAGRSHPPPNRRPARHGLWMGAIGRRGFDFVRDVFRRRPRIAEFAHAFGSTQPARRADSGENGGGE